MKYKKYTRAYEDRVITLLESCFKDKQITRKSFEWKYFSNYYSGRAIAYIAVDQQKVCSFVCFDPVVIKNGESKVIFYSCSIQVTSPEYRRKGLVTKLTQLVECDLPKNMSYFGFSNKNGVLIDKNSRNINYKIISKLRRTYFLSMPYFGSIKLQKIKKIKINDVVYNSWQGFQIEKTYNYLKWRYIDNPKYRFEFYNIQNRNNIVGLAILQRTSNAFELVDLILKDFNFVNETIKAILGLTFKSGNILLKFTYLENKYFSFAFPMLFFTRNINIYFTLKSKINNVLNPNKWLILGGDIQ